MGTNALLCRVSHLLRVKASQSTTLKDLEKRMKVLESKRENFEELTGYTLAVQNVRLFVVGLLC